MSLILPGTRYICSRCMQRASARATQPFSTAQWRGQSDTSIRLQRGDDGIKKERRTPRSTAYKANINQVTDTGIQRRWERRTRMRTPQSSETELEKRGARDSKSKPQRIATHENETAVSNLGEAYGVPAQETTEGKSLNPGSSSSELLPSITTILRPLDFNLYWDTLPPTFQERSQANYFFSSACETNPPQLLTSVERFMQVPESDVPEVAFVGRSNVGKSSLLNAIVGADMKKLLARTSATPGFTKTMNFYGIGPGFGVALTKDDQGHSRIIGRGIVLVDMPGYGEGSLAQWGIEIMKYIQSRKQLRRVFVLLDAEHGIKDKDRSLLASLRLAGVPHQIILSKADKLYVPQGKGVKLLDGTKFKTLKPKGTIDSLKQAMEKLKPEIQPPVGGGALGEILACSSTTLVNWQRFGMDHVRYAIVKAAGVDKKPKRPGKRTRDAIIKSRGKEKNGKDTDVD